MAVEKGEGGGAAAEEAAESVERYFRGGRRPPAGDLRDSVEVPSVQRDRHHYLTRSLSLSL